MGKNGTSGSWAAYKSFRETDNNREFKTAADRQKNTNKWKQVEELEYRTRKLLMKKKEKDFIEWKYNFKTENRLQVKKWFLRQELRNDKTVYTGKSLIFKIYILILQKRLNRENLFSLLFQNFVIWVNLKIKLKKGLFMSFKLFYLPFLTMSLFHLFMGFRTRVMTVRDGIRIQAQELILEQFFRIIPIVSAG